MDCKNRKTYKDWQIRNYVDRYRTSGISLNEFARRECIPNSSLSRWIKKNGEIQPKKKRLPVYPEIENELLRWVLEERAKGFPLDDKDLKKKSLEIAVRTATKGFKASRGWIYTFKQRKKLSFRTATHTSRKEKFTEKDLEEQEHFFEELVEIVDIQNTSPDDILNFDQTNVKFVPSKKKTIDVKGAKQVNVVDAPGEKDGFTVSLAVSASGEKLPAVVVFKGSVKTGVLSDRIMSKLTIPSNVRVMSSRSSWWNESLDHKWIIETFEIGGDPKVLLRDQFTVHKMYSCAELLSERNVRQIFIPVAMTGFYQPLDVGVNRPFKVYYQEEYHVWRQAHRETTKSGYLIKPNRQDILHFISAAWFRITPKIIQNSFVAAQIIDRNILEKKDLENVPPTAELEANETSRLETSWDFDESFSDGEE